MSSFFLKKSLNPVMIPFLASVGGNCQEAVVLVEELTTTVKLSGDSEGTGTRDSLIHQYIMKSVL